MRTKTLSLFLALMLAIGAMSLPLTAYAAGGKDDVPPQLTASLDGDTLKIESSDDNSGVEAVFVDGNRINSLTNGTAAVTLKDYAGTEKQVSVYAQDYAGNRSEAVKFDNPYYEEPKKTEMPSAAPQKPETTETAKPAQAPAASSGSQGTATQNKGGSNASNQGASPAGASTGGSTSSGSSNSGNGSNAGGNAGSNTASGSQEETETTSSVPEGAFTPEGSGTVLDTATGADGDKQFYTITTEAGNVFYLIVDGKRDSNNVYFLNGVTETDLMALAEKSGGTMSAVPAEDVCTCTEKCAAGEVNTSCPVCKNDLKGCIGKEKPAEPEKTDEPKPAKKENNAGTIIFVISALLAVGGIGYYVKIVRPKQLAEDEDGFEDDGYGEGFDPDEAFGEMEYLSEDDFDDRMEDNGPKDGE